MYKCSLSLTYLTVSENSETLNSTLTYYLSRDALIKMLTERQLKDWKICVVLSIFSLGLEELEGGFSFLIPYNAPTVRKRETLLYTSILFDGLAPGWSMVFSGLHLYIAVSVGPWPVLHLHWAVGEWLERKLHITTALFSWIGSSLFMCVGRERGDFIFGAYLSLVPPLFFWLVV